MNKVLDTCVFFFRRHSSVMIWISVVLYLFYDTFIAYNTGAQYRHLRSILGTGLCFSRATAAVLNVCCALVLIPVCKKLNQLLYHALSRIWPKLLFFWLERAKSCHMTLATTLVVFAVAHSGAHFANLWSFSKYYDDEHRSVNFADHRNQSTLELLLRLPVVTGVSMLLITTLMACSSLRRVRRHHYNLFRYTHQLFFLFMALLLIHPLSGVLKEEVIVKQETILQKSNVTNSTRISPIFLPIKSKTWMWISLPLLCCSLDLLWRFCSRNQANVTILRVCRLQGRAISMCLSSPSSEFRCRVGQYVLIQCPDISMLEWHPFSVTKIPSYEQPYFNLLIRVKGDWTEMLDKLVEQYTTLIEIPLQVLVDGPYCSPLESMVRSEVALCVAAGVGITPFSSLLAELLKNPRSRHPGRIHLIWIVRQECELSWIAELANKVLIHLRESNRPDRLNLELYVTNSSYSNHNATMSHSVRMEGRENIQHFVGSHLSEYRDNSEKAVLLTPKIDRTKKRREIKHSINDSIHFFTEKNEDHRKLLNCYPLLYCRVKYGRPNWDKLFEYWTHLYPRKKLPLYCCGPKKLTDTLRHHCLLTNRTETTIHLIHEGFS